MKTPLLYTAALLSLGLVAPVAHADDPTGAPPEIAIGAKIRIGGRYDDVRMCVASPPGAKGGPAMDISFFVQRDLSPDLLLAVDVPVVRPILFAAAFQMLQFEPTAGLQWRLGSSERLLAGPVVGLSLHYGPDYESGPNGAERGPSFFAMGPIFGGFLGWDLRHEGRSFGTQLGLTPYIAPLFGLANDRRGIVAGGQLDVLLGG